jgi:hypothetical protein
MSSFFDLPEDSFSKGSSQKGFTEDPNIYDPNPDKYNGSYKSVVRFIPYMKDKTKSKYTKYTCKIWNPLTKEKVVVDCPSNEEKPSFLWTLESVIRSLKKEEPELHENLSRSFSRWYTHTSPIYIKKDPQRPDLEGQIKFIQFRSQINDFIEQQMNPEDVDGMVSTRKINPYHLLEGRDFLCVVSKKTKEFRDWSKCKFMDEVTPLVFKVGEKQIAASNDEKIVKALQEFLTKNTPDMDKYYHVAWTEDTYEQVADALASTIPNSVLEMAIQKSKDQKMNSLIKERMGLKQKNAPKVSQFEEDPLSFGGTTVNQQTMSTSTSSDSDDEYDDLFKDL